MITILEQKIIANFQIVHEPEIHITGQSSDHNRTMVVSFPVYNESGVRIDTIVKSYQGVEFNEAYSCFNSDKSLVEKVFSDLGLIADQSEMPTNLEN